MESYCKCDPFMSINSLAERDITEEELHYIQDLIDNEKTGLQKRMAEFLVSYSLCKKFAIVKEALTTYHEEKDEKTKEKFAVRIAIMIADALFHELAVRWYVKLKNLPEGKELDCAITDMTYDEVRAASHL